MTTHHLIVEVSNPDWSSPMRVTLDDFPTADQLRYIAKSLDLLSAFTKTALPSMTINGEPIAGEILEQLREWIEGTEQQDDLRRWADALDEAMR